MKPNWTRGELADGPCVTSAYSTKALTATDTRPTAVWRGVKVMAHSRIIFCLAHGVVPKDIKGLYVLHTCDNSQCVNPAHLRLGTHTNNMQDKSDRFRGVAGNKTKGSNTKLTERDVLAIRNDTCSTQAELAKSYGVSRSAISMIKLRITWTHI